MSILTRLFTGQAETSHQIKAAELIQAVKKMRECQHEYFNHRDQTSLHRAKGAEREVDRLLDAVATEKPEGLFE